MKTILTLTSILLAITLAGCSAKVEITQNPNLAKIRVLTSQKPVLIDGKFTTEEIAEKVLSDVNRIFYADMGSLLRAFEYVTIIKLDYPPQEPGDTYMVILSNFKPVVTAIDPGKNFDFEGPQLWFTVDTFEKFFGHKLNYRNKFHFFRSNWIFWSLTLETDNILVIS